MNRTTGKVIFDCLGVVVPESQINTLHDVTMYMRAYTKLVVADIPWIGNSSHCGIVTSCVDILMHKFIQCHPYKPLCQIKLERCMHKYPTKWLLEDDNMLQLLTGMVETCKIYIEELKKLDIISIELWQEKTLAY